MVRRTNNMHCCACLLTVFPLAGCTLHRYKEKEASACFRSKELIFIGDSVTRKLFFQVVQVLDRSSPSEPPNDAGKHANHRFHTTSGIDLTFAWDPFLNSSYTESVLLKSRDNDTTQSLRSPAMLVLGSGLWYLRYSNSSGGVPAWGSRLKHIFHLLATNPKPADEVVILPVENIISSNLTPERASTMHPSDIDAMNSDLYHRINPPSDDFRYSFTRSATAYLPLVFNQMIDESLTEDGLHYSDTVIKAQANILFNLQCNNKLPKTFPFNKTCCNRYPWPSAIHLTVLGLVVLSGPWLVYRAVVPGETHSFMVPLPTKSDFCKFRPRQTICLSHRAASSSSLYHQWSSCLDIYR